MIRASLFSTRNLFIAMYNKYAKLRQRAVLLFTVALLAFTNIPSLKDKLSSANTVGGQNDRPHQVEPRAVVLPQPNEVDRSQRAPLPPETQRITPSPVQNIQSAVTSSTPLISKSTLHPLEQWRVRRQMLLSKKAAKVVLFAYMRGGSTLGAQLFNINPRATMWYEPGDAFFSAYFGIETSLPQNDVYNRDMTRRSAGMKEKQWFRDYYTNIFECHFENLPPELFSHRNIRQSIGMKNFTSCMANSQPMSPTARQCTDFIKSLCGLRFVETSWKVNCHVVLQTSRSVVQRNNGSIDELTTLIQEQLNAKNIELVPLISTHLANFTKYQLCIERVRMDNSRCLHLAVDKCHADTVRTVKILRHRMEDLEPLIVANPDLFVVHYVRDPRAIASSRTRTNYLMWDKMDKRPAREAQIVCRRMMEDLRHRLQLEERYPGVFLQVKYEDLASRPLDVAGDVYAFIGRDAPTSWPTYVNGIMHGNHSTAFSIVVSNVTDHVTAWKRRIPTDQQEDIKNFCGDLLKMLRYTD